MAKIGFWAKNPTLSHKWDFYGNNRIFISLWGSKFEPKISYYRIADHKIRVWAGNMISMAIIRFSSQKMRHWPEIRCLRKNPILSQIIRHWPKIWFLLQWYNFRAKNLSMGKKYQALWIYSKYEFTMVSRDSCFFFAKKTYLGFY